MFIASGGLMEAGQFVIPAPNYRFGGVSNAFTNLFLHLQAVETDKADFQHYRREAEPWLYMLSLMGTLVMVVGLKPGPVKPHKPVP